MKKKDLIRLRNNTRILDKIDFGDFRDRLTEDLDFKETNDVCVKLLKDKGFDNPTLEGSVRTEPIFITDKIIMRALYGDLYYSRPRENGLNKYEYIAMEVSIQKIGQGFLLPGNHVFTYKEIDWCWDDMIGYYVNVEDIQYLYGRLMRKFKGGRYNGNND